MSARRHPGAARAPAGVAPVGEWSVIVLLVVGIVIGLLVAYLAPPRSTTVVPPAAPAQPPAPTAPPAE